MNGEKIKEFLVGLGFEVQGEGEFTSAVSKATVAVAAIGAAAVAAAAGLFHFTAAVADHFDALGDMSNRTNIAVSSIEEFGYVAMMTGSSIEEANASLEQFSKVAGDAANGMGRGQKVFEQLGISVKDNNGKLKDSVGLLGEVGDKIKDMERGQQIAVLERLGLSKTLIDSMTTDVTGLRDEFHQLYSSVGLDANAAAEKSGRFMDAMDKLGYVFTVIGRAFAVNFMDKFTDSMDTLRKLVLELAPKLLAILKPVVDIVLRIADTFISLAYRAAQAVGVVIGWVADIVSHMNKWVIGIGLVLAAWRYLNLAFLATPAGAVLALVAAVGLLIDDFMTWQEGGQSLVPWGDWETEIGYVVKAIDILKSVIEQSFNIIFALVDAAVQVFSGDFPAALRAVNAAIESMTKILSTLFGPALDAVKNQFKAAFDYIAGLITGVMDKASGAIGWIKGAADKVGSIFGDSDEDAPKVKANQPRPAISLLAPSPAQAANLAPNQTTQSLNQTTSIIVQGSADPTATGRAVAGQQRDVNSDMARNLKGAVR